MKRICLALDLKDDPQLIAEYEAYHRTVWPEITQSILDTGILSLEIYRVGNRLFMIIEADKAFTLEKKKEMDSKNPRVGEWEDLMWKYQQALPIAAKGEKWVPMEKIFMVTA